MNERAKITASHLARHAVVYLRQSSAAQVEHNRESTERQYALASKARELGLRAERIVIIDEDLGLSGGGTATRSGFARLTAEVALARVGLVLGLEVSRLARNNAEWYRLIDLAGLTDTLIGDGDGLYHPAVLNDRLLRGLKGIERTPSLKPKFPASRENTGNFIDSVLGRASTVEKTSVISIFYGPIPYASEQGIFCR